MKIKLKLMQKIQILQIKLNINCVIFYLFLKERRSHKKSQKRKEREQPNKQHSFIDQRNVFSESEWKSIEIIKTVILLKRSNILGTIFNMKMLL